MDVGRVVERAVHYDGGSLSDRRQQQLRSATARCSKEEWWIGVVVVHQIVRSGSRAQLHRGACLASRTLGICTFSALHQMKIRRQVIFYISLERKGVCSNKYVSLHKYEAISAPRCGVYWSSRLFWCNILGPRPAIWGLCREALLPYLLDMNNIAGAKILRL